MGKAARAQVGRTGGSKEKVARVQAAATIGVFDGVHRGHQELMRRVASAARALPGAAVAVTFARHPLAVLDPARCPALLTTVDERRALLMAEGITDVQVIEFDLEIAKLSAREFLESVLFDRYDLRVLVVGPDFAMGRDREGDVAALGALGAELGFRLEVVEPVAGLGGPVSSTRLRRALVAGEMDVARELMGRDYRVAGMVVGGHGRGLEIGFPTANLAIEEGKMLPGDGVYAALAATGEPGMTGKPGTTGKSATGAAGKLAAAGQFAAAAELAPAGEPGIWRPAVVNLGLAPTFGEGERRVEVHLLHTREDLRGRRLEVRFVARLRGEQRFPNVDALRAQIQADVAAAREALERLPARSGIQ